MKLDWKNWSFGGKIIFVATCIATLSMFMVWDDVSQSRLPLRSALILLGLYIYPLIMLLKNRIIIKLWGLVCSIIAVVFSLLYLVSSVSNYSVVTGSWSYMFSSFGLMVGIIKYHPYNEHHRRSAEQVAPADADKPRELYR